MAALYLGVDVGTTGTKTMLVSETGQVIRTEYRAYPTKRRQEGYAEQNPQDWWDTLVYTVRACAQGHQSDIKAMALSTQAATVVPTDGNGNPLCCAITWQDSRAGKIGDRLNETHGQDYFYHKTGWRLSSGFNFLSMMWLKENEPELFQKTDKFLSVNEYLNFKLTGNFAGDPVNAGITQLFDIKNCTYDQEMLDFLNISEDNLAKLYPPGTVIGTLTADAAQELGLDTATKVVLAGQDQYCSAIGMGALKEGDIPMSTGTAWVMLPISEKPLFHTASYIAPGRHIEEGMWGNMATLTTGGVALEWCKELCGWGEKAYAQMDEAAQNTPAGAEGLMLLPFFQGATAPVWNNDLRATLFGLELRHGKNELIRGVMEGVVLQMNLIFDSIKEMGFVPKVLKVAGGATKSRPWVQIIADITNTPVELPGAPDMACIGAALVAAKADGLFETYEQGITAWEKQPRYVFPNPKTVGFYEDWFALYKKRVTQLKELYA